MNLERWDAPRPVRLRVADFLRLQEAGAFTDYAKTELIGGEIVAVNAQYSSHGEAKRLLFLRLSAAVERALPGHRVWSEVSVAIPPDGTPAPDLFVTSFRPRPRAVTPVDTVPLVVEIADTTTAFDLGPKLRLYARGGVPEYWVVELERGVVRQHWTPGPEGYAERREIVFGERLEARTLPGLAVDTGGLS